MVGSEGVTPFTRPVDDPRLVVVDLALAIGYVALSAVLWHAGPPAPPGAFGVALAAPAADMCWWAANRSGT